MSYAHDNPAHEDVVRNFYYFLRSQGIDARIDVVAAQQRQDWSLWMADEVRNANFVLVIASPAYRERAEGRSDVAVGRGVHWEGRLIRDAFYRDQSDLNRFLPVILPGETADGVPDFLAPTSSTVYTVVDFTVAGAEALLRLLTSQPAEIETPLGPLPLLEPRPVGSATPMTAQADQESAPDRPRVLNTVKSTTTRPLARADTATCVPVSSSPTADLHSGQAGPMTDNNRVDQIAARSNEDKAARLGRGQIPRRAEILAQLQQISDEDPMPEDARQNGHLYLVAHPDAAPEESLVGLLTQQDPAQVINKVLSQIRDARGGSAFEPDLQQLRWGIPHPDGRAFATFAADERIYEPGMIRLVVHEDGGISLTCGRGTDIRPHRSSSTVPPSRVVISALVLGITHSFVALAGVGASIRGLPGRVESRCAHGPSSRRGRVRNGI